VRILPFVLLILTGVTGIVDAASFLSLGHIFTANMTGNVVFIAFACAGAQGLSVARSGTALVGFLAGAALGGQMALHLERNARRWVATALFVQATSIFLATAVVIGSAARLSDGRMQLYMVIALTAVAMGVQNATALRLAMPGLAPNVLTGALTGVAGGPLLLRGHDPLWTRRLASVTTMFAGALLGAWLQHFSDIWPLALCGALSALCGLAISADKSPVAVSPESLGVTGSLPRSKKYGSEKISRAGAPIP
jgi:uncharacterized membrane protein YoaK (UPF0700 family)